MSGVSRFLRRDWLLSVMLMVILAIALAAIFAPWIAPFDPNKSSILNRLKPLGFEAYVLGTDEQGRDMLSRLLWGGRISLLCGVLPVVLATLVGGTLGTVSGYLQGGIGQVIMRSMDVVFAFPSVLLAIAIAASIGGGLVAQVLTIAVVLTPPICRVAEIATAQARSADYVAAAMISGASLLPILTRQVLPNVAAPVLVFASTQLSGAILLAAALSFLGLGVSPPTADWGLMLSTLRDSVFSQPLVCALPGIAILVTSLAFNLASDGVRELLDVRRQG